MTDDPSPSAKVVSSDPLLGLRPEEINTCMIDPKLRKRVLEALNNNPAVNKENNHDKQQG